ncbi:peptidylprolyl isomerase [Jeongeupia naejangsanensis]|uniref:peptidylprolyl isomerase n=1 Tax=Jeongeupia naejangsanensis TaxID=613195 RepID=A0ABS2BJZ7_9NEIS|nr:peptidylprolyl isomerase [Jeongeupia naejangsanensis]MBM3115934.1 peptidylprolyl isomerase [Jeongeupia naejangsanensis]
MAILVNGVEITDAQIEAELPHHQDAPSPVDATVQELILRELLTQRARAKGIEATDPQEAVGELLGQEIEAPKVDEAQARAFYDANPQAFVQGEQVEASHILFKSTPETPAALMRGKAEQVLMELRLAPHLFETRAKELSACPSGQQGGALGSFGRGQMVPEFEQAAFALGEGELAKELVETQFGLHIIKAGKKTGGASVSFDEVQERLTAYLTEMEARRAMHTYLQGLVEAADIQGYDLKAAGQ